LEMIDLLIKNGKFVMTMNPDRDILSDASIAVDKGKILEIGPAAIVNSKYQAKKMINAANFFVTPGFINSHVHLESCYDKGMLDDVPVVPWCERYFSYTYGALTPENYYLAVATTLIKGIKSGTTLFNDFGTIQTMEDSAAQAVIDTGVRACLGRDLMDIHGSTSSAYVSYDAFNDLVARLQEDTDTALSRSEDFIKKWHNAGNGRVKAWLDLQQVCNVSPELCKGVRQLANKNKGVGIQTHAGVSPDMQEMTRKRFGQRDIIYLYEQGVLGPDFIAAHMGNVNGMEQRLMAETKSNVAHVPGSSMHGVYSACSHRGRIVEMWSMGVNIGVGNDEDSTGTCHDIVRDIWAVSVAHAEARDPWLFPSREHFMLATNDPNPVAIEMATVNGARAALQEDVIGSLEVGKEADLAMYDLTMFPWIPTARENVINNFVYNGTGLTCDTVICQGQIVMEGRHILSVDEEKILSEAQKWGEKIIPTAPWLKSPETWELKWVKE
jgi:5-methylthioadenosine/S-adenosylhomocysteine deaminase